MGFLKDLFNTITEDPYVAEMNKAKALEKEIADDIASLKNKAAILDEEKPFWSETPDTYYVNCLDNVVVFELNEGIRDNNSGYTKQRFHDVEISYFDSKTNDHFYCIYSFSGIEIGNQKKIDYFVKNNGAQKVGAYGVNKCITMDTNKYTPQSYAIIEDSYAGDRKMTMLIAGSKSKYYLQASISGSSSYYGPSKIYDVMMEKFFIRF